MTFLDLEKIKRVSKGPSLNVSTESVHKIRRQNLSKIKLCDWPNNLDATSWQV